MRAEEQYRLSMAVCAQSPMHKHKYLYVSNFLNTWFSFICIHGFSVSVCVSLPLSLFNSRVRVCGLGPDVLVCSAAGLSVFEWSNTKMGGTGPSGGFDIHNLFNGAPPGPYPPQYPSHHAFPSGQYPTASNFSSNASSFSSIPVQSYQYGAGPQQQQQQQQQGLSPLYHPYMPYPQEHGSRPQSPYTSSAFSMQQQQSQQFSQPSLPVSHLSQPSPPLSSLPRSPMVHISSSPTPASASPLDGARLMALLTTHSVGESPSKEDETLASVAGPPQNAMEHPRSSHASAPEVSVPPPAIALAMPTAPPVNMVLSSGSSRFSSNKLPKGRALRGEHVVYDVDVRRNGEAQPQLEVSPITVYTSDPVLLMGRQIAVNRRYICYGLRGGNIRILNVNTALRALLRGHTQV